MTNINISWGKKIFLIIFLIPVSLCNAYNTPHFYRATPFFLEPRFEKPWLSSLDIDFGRGHTSTGFDQYKNKVNILNIYGLHNMHQLGANRPHKHSPSITDTLLDQLANLPSPSPHFGLLSLKGSFNTKELNACFTQNLTRGFFIRAHIPLTTFNIKLISITDLTPEHDKHIPEWQAFLKAFNTILNEYHIEKKPIYKTHAGDTSVMVGWAINYQDTSLLDFIDFSIQGGILIPTGEKKNENNILSLPYGHHKHWGAPFAADIALGWYEWITVGAHIDILALGKKNQKIRINTAPSHRGLIKLTKSCALVNPGILWRLGAYIKADHVIHGFSLRTGYSCAYKGTDKIYPLEKEFDSTIANNDESLKKWYMHTIHAALEYDFTKEYQVLGPRVGLFINIPISGKRIFKTTISGFSGGLEITM